MRRLLMQSPLAIALCWIGTYLFIPLLPLFILLVHPAPIGRSFWVEFSAALGFIGLALMTLQFVLTARIRQIEASYGIDILLQFHRYTSIVAFLMVIAHPIILFVVQPKTLQLLNLADAPWRARLGVLGIVAFILLVVTTIARKQLRIPYELWRSSHTILSVLAVAMGFAHTIGVRHYLTFFWKEIVWSVILLVALSLIVYVRLIRPWRLMKRPYIVEEVIPQRGDVCTLSLRPLHHPGFYFQPGQFAWLTLNTTPFKMREHPFSMSSSGIRRDRIEFGIKALGDFTRSIRTIRPGTCAYLDGPYGVFTTDRYEDSAGFVLIAGGIGITPMKSMLVTAAERGDNRPFLLIYANRSWNDIAFREDLDDLKANVNLEIVHVLRDPPDDWSGETGYVDKALLARTIPKRRGTRQYFICAAPKMMDEVERALFDLYVPVTNVHMEHFNLA